MIGMQLNLYDVSDEGAEQVVANSAMAGASVLLPAITYYRETRDDQVAIGLQAGSLPHNDKRDHHEADGGAYFRANPALYPEGFSPPESVTSGVDGQSAMEALTAAAASQEISVVPWVTLLHMHRVCEQVPEACVVNARGERVDSWLCPSRQDTIGFVSGLLTDIIEQFRPPGLFIDRFRFPEWGPNGLIDACSCFCDSCLEAGRTANIDVDSARAFLLSVIDLLERDPAGAGELGSSIFSSGIGTVRASAERTTLLQWFTWRQRIIERLVATAHRVVRPYGVELWLDVWPPSYGWLLGQDLSRLSAYAEWVKPFTYHRLGGGADMAGIINRLATETGSRQAIYDAFLRFFGFPAPAQFSEFEERGLDPTFITTESVLAQRLIAGQAKYATGLLLWLVDEDAVRESLEHAWKAGPDGVIFHCHGWARLQDLAAAGEWIRARRATRT
jgi:hypothetical protein